jgi:sugar (pentulose or hexulose) kinase
MILASDLGSTTLKVAIFAYDGRRLGDSSLPLPYSVHTPDHSELLPTAVWQTFQEAVLVALRSAGIHAGEIDRAAFTSQAQTFCVCDASGDAIGPFLGWADNRALKEAAFLGEKYGDDFHAKTGWPEVKPGLFISKALWWRNRHEFWPEHRFVLLPSFLAMALGAPHFVDSNLAAMTGCYCIPDGTWWPAAIDTLGVTPSQLGQVVPTGEALDVKPVPPNPLLPGLRSVVMAGNDHTAGAVGCGCSASRSVLTLGTAGVFYRFAGPSPGPYSPDGLWGPYPGGGYYELRFTSHACSALDWADGYLFGKVDSPRFVEMATRAPAGSCGIRFDPDKWGSSEAWSSVGTPEAMALAVLEGITEKVQQLVAPALKEPPDSKPEILLLGGGSRLLPWVQMLEQKLGASLQPAAADGLRGVAMLAGAAISQ